MKSVSIPLFCILMLLAFPSQARRHVIAIAAHYGTSGEATLRFAKQDAERVLNVFWDVGETSPANTVLLVDPSSKEVKSTFSALADGRMKTEDTLVVYVSSHMDEQSIHLGPERLPFRELFDLSRLCGASLRVFILDGCQSGSVTVKGVQRLASAKVIRPEPNPAEGEVILTASSPHEDALESERLSGSFFTHYLVTGLRGAADSNTDGRVSIEEVFRFAHDSTVYATAGSPTGSQHPAFKIDVAGSSAAILTEPSASSDDLARLRIRNTQNAVVYMMRKSNNQLEAEISLESPSVLVLRPGEFRVRLASASGISEGELTLAANATGDLDGIEWRSVPLITLVRKGEGQASRRFMIRTEISGGMTDIDHFKPTLSLGAGGSVEWRTISILFGFSYGYAYDANSNVRFNLHRLALSGGVAHPLQLGPLILSFGLELEGILYQQVLEAKLSGVKTNGNRASLAIGLVPLIRLELPVGSQLVPSLTLRGRLIFGNNQGAYFAPTAGIGFGWVF